MDIKNAIYTEDGAISATVNGKELVFPSAAGNRHYDELIRQGITSESYVVPVKTWQEKRAVSLADGGYGTVTEQLEMIGEQGIGAFQKHIAAVKVAHPKS